MKTFLRMDSGSMPAALMQQIRAANGSLSQVDGDVCLFDYDPAILGHALFLMGQNPGRFGHDVSHYLNNAAFFYARRATDQYVRLDFGPVDFRKRFAEDLAVAQSCIFMNSSFAVAWVSMAQIPENRKLSKLRPDFEGFNSANDRFLFEAKGTTVTNSVEPFIQKGLKQVKQYPEPALHKLVLASYFSCDTRSFPNFLFVIDPEMPDIVLPDLRSARLLHAVKVLEYLKLEDAKRAFLHFLRYRFTSDQAARTGQMNNRADALSMSAKEAFQASLTSARQGLTSWQLGDWELQGHVQIALVHEQKYELRFGARVDVLDAISRAELLP